MESFCLTSVVCGGVSSTLEIAELANLALWA